MPKERREWVDPPARSCGRSGGCERSDAITSARDIYYVVATAYRLKFASSENLDMCKLQKYDAYIFQILVIP